MHHLGDLFLSLAGLFHKSTNSLLHLVGTHLALVGNVGQQVECALRNFAALGAIFNSVTHLRLPFKQLAEQGIAVNGSVGSDRDVECLATKHGATLAAHRGPRALELRASLRSDGGDVDRVAKADKPLNHVVVQPLIRSVKIPEEGVILKERRAFGDVVGSMGVKLQIAEHRRQFSKSFHGLSISLF